MMGRNWGKVEDDEKREEEEKPWILVFTLQITSSAAPVASTTTSSYKPSRPGLTQRPFHLLLGLSASLLHTD
jgi:hypothetical protein